MKVIKYCGVSRTVGENKDENENIELATLMYVFVSGETLKSGTNNRNKKNGPASNNNIIFFCLNIVILNILIK